MKTILNFIKFYSKFISNLVFIIPMLNKKTFLASFASLIYVYSSLPLDSALLCTVIPYVSIPDDPRLTFVGSYSEEKTYCRIFKLERLENKSCKHFFLSIYKALWRSDLFVSFGRIREIKIKVYDIGDDTMDLFKDPIKVDAYISFRSFYKLAKMSLQIPYGNFDTSCVIIYVSTEKTGRHKTSNVYGIVKSVNLKNDNKKIITPYQKVKKFYPIIIILLCLYFLDIGYITDLNSSTLIKMSFWTKPFASFFNPKEPARLVESVENRSGNKSINRIEVNTTYSDTNLESAEKLYDILWNFDGFLKHGSKKIFFVTAYRCSVKGYIAFHPNILVTNNTTKAEYLKLIEEYIRLSNTWYDGEETFIKFMVTVVDATPFQNSEINVVKVKNDRGGYDSTRITVKPKKGSRSFSSLVKPIGRRSFSSSSCNNHSSGITKLKKIPVNVKPIATVDIETIIMDPVTKVHVPIAISTVSKDFSKLFIIDRKLLETDPQKAVSQMFTEYLNFMQSLNKSYVIFAHNLGGYDGLLLYKNFLKIPGKIHNFKCLIDADHRFISIDYRYSYLNGRMKSSKNITLTWKDSLRLFPGSLESLCKQFNVVGKISKYDMAFNNISLFDNPELLEKFKTYSLQDSIALYDALIAAQKLYFEKYKVDISSTYSTASLAFKIYRTNFIQHDIPLLTYSEDVFIRRAYYGGATDYYKACGEELYWYDVNSLYPYAMMGELPYKIVKKHKDLSGVNVKDFKGFVKARVTCPDNIKHPLIPCRTKERVIYPTGTWVETYFSDLLAKAQDFGYKIELIEGIEFEYVDLFSDYIKHFYEIKKTSTGSLKYLAKLKLNSLYGMFGRRKDTLTTENVLNEDLENHLLKNNVCNIIKISDKVSTVISEDVTDKKILRNLNTLLTGHDIGSGNDSTALANVAIAAAITARAQMVMMDYKNNPDFDVYYTDTDSIFTDKPLPSHLVGDGLGQMKNEALDKWGVEKIDKACFVGIKKYGLSVTDSKGVLHESSVFSGVPRNSLTFDEVLQIQSGSIIERKIENRFVKSFENLEISNQKSFILHISNKRDKKLVNNNYNPINVKSLKPSVIKSITDLILKRLNYLKKKFL